MAKTKYKVANMDSLPDEKELKKSKKHESMEEVEAPAEEVSEAEEPVEQVQTGKKSGQSGRSKRYHEALTKVDRMKLYSLQDAVELLQSLPQPKFDASVDVHLVLKEITSSVDVAFPHSTGRTLTVAIFSDDTIADLEKGSMNFDVLLATPAQMGKLTKFARLLGPKGLMPNPKNGTLITDPEKRKKELESGKVTVRGEKKSPLLHTTVGKISMPTESLVSNIETLLKACTGKVLKVTIATSMSPGVKVAL